MDTTTAREIGRKAFAAGARCIPSADPAIMAAIADLPVGGGAVEIMKAWQAGWTDGNLAAPVADVPALAAAAQHARRNLFAAVAEGVDLADVEAAQLAADTALLDACGWDPEAALAAERAYCASLTEV